jgi:hypothetical protein
LNILMLENMKDGNWFMQMVLIPCFNIVHSWIHLKMVLVIWSLDFDLLYYDTV